MLMMPWTARKITHDEWLVTSPSGDETLVRARYAEEAINKVQALELVGSR